MIVLDLKAKSSRGAERRRRIGHEKKKEMLVGLSIFLIVALLIGGGVWYWFSSSSALSGQSSVNLQSAATANTAEELVSDSPPTLGSAAAPVTIVEFGDFQCPSCGGWFRTEKAQIVQDLVQTGKAKLVWRDFDYYGPDSTYASEAAYAVGEQGNFWQMYDLLYSSQQEPNSGWASSQNLEGFAQQLGLNMTQFNANFQNGKYASIINANYQLGSALGVNGTPTFFVIGSSGRVITISGGQPYSVFESAVNSLTSG